MYYGCDTNSGCFPCGYSDFYLGNLGYGTTASGQFNNAAAQTVIANSGQVFGYWTVWGPSADPVYKNNPSAYTTSDALRWGTTQANSAVKAWNNKTSVGNPVLFGDVEKNDYWVSNVNLNRSVFKGFAQKVNSSLVAGAYASPSNWSSIMGSTSYSVSPASYTWIADWSEACNACPTAMTTTEFGGISPTFWQYNGCTSSCPTDCGSGGSPCSYDLDAAAYLP